MNSRSKRNKSNSKPQQTENPKEVPVSASRCEACFDKQPIDIASPDVLTCAKCHKKCHRNCYQPDFKGNTSDFVCDPCKKNKAPQCQICSHSKGLLKAVQCKDQIYIHVPCGLLNYNTISVIKYSNLSFSENNDIPKEQNKKMEAKCGICKKGSGMGSNLIKCRMCTYSAHIYCINNLPKKSTPWDITNLLLDKNKFQYRNIVNLGRHEKFNLLNCIKENEKQNVIELICPNHSDQTLYNYCFCDQPPIDEDQKLLLACDVCGRWVHFICSGLDDKDDYLECSACQKKQILGQQVKYPRLIQQACAMENDHKIGHRGVNKKLCMFDQFPIPISKALANQLTEPEVFKHYFNFHLQEMIEPLEKSKHKPDLNKFFKDSKLLDLLCFSINGTQQNHFQEAKSLTLQSKLQKVVSQLLKAQNPIKKELKQKVMSFVKDFAAIKNIQIIEPCRSNGHTNSKKHTYQQQQPKTSLLERVQKLLSKIEKCINKEDQPEVLYQQIQTLSLQLESIRKETSSENLNQIVGDGLLSILITSLIDKELIGDFLQLYKYIIRREGKANSEIDEHIYHRANRLLRKLPEEQKAKYRQYFKSLLQPQKIKGKYEQKAQFIKKTLNMIKNKTLNPKSFQHVSKIATKHDIYLAKQGSFQQMQEQEVYYTSLKKKCLRAIEKPLNKAQTQQLICRINELIWKGSYVLNKRQNYQLKKYPMKYQFFERIVQKYQSICPKSISLDGGVSFNEMEDESEDNHNVFDEVRKIFSTERLGKFNFFDLAKELSILHQNSVALNEEQKKVISNGFGALLDVLAESSQEKSLSALNFQELRHYVNAFKFTNYCGKFTNYQDEYDKYMQWQKPLRDLKFQAALEKEETNEQMISILDDLINDDNNIKINLTEEKRKIGVLRLWCNISRKHFEIFCKKRKKRPTINAVQQFKDLLKSSQYPHNQIYSKTITCQAQAIILNNRISRFLQRPKLVENQVYEEILFFKNKMTQEQANKLLDSMKISNFDVSAEIKQLQDLIKQFKKSSSEEHINAIEKHNVVQLMALKKRMMEFPIRCDNQEALQQVIKAIYSLKALQFNPPIQRKQFQKVIQLGGKNAIQMLENNLKANCLARVYKLIEKAQKEVFVTKRNEKHFLQFSDYRKVIEDLEPDPALRATVEKWYQIVRGHKEKTARAKNGFPEDIDKLKMREEQMMRIPVNSQEIIDEQIKMKRDIDQFNSRIRNQTIGSIICKTGSSSCMEEYGRRYRIIGIKNQTFQKLVSDYDQYQEIKRRAIDCKPQNYRMFSIKCTQNTQVAKVELVWRLRFQYFDKIYEDVIKSGDPQPELLNCLLQQGSQIIQHPDINNRQRKSLFLRLLELNKKLIDIDNSEDEQSDQSQHLEQELEENDDSGSIDESQDIDGQQEDQNQEPPNESSQAADKRRRKSSGVQLNGKKRPPAVVELDDDED